MAPAASLTLNKNAVFHPKKYIFQPKKAPAASLTRKTAISHTEKAPAAMLTRKKNTYLSTVVKFTSQAKKN